MRTGKQEAADKIADGEQKIADAKQQLADAEEKIRRMRSGSLRI